MAMMVDIAVAPATPPASPQAKPGKTAEGEKDGFRKALDKENTRQAKNAGERQETEQGDDPRQITDQAAAATSAPAAAQTADKPETAAEESDPVPKTVAAVTPATTASLQPPTAVEGEAQSAPVVPEIPQGAVAKTAPATGIETQPAASGGIAPKNMDAITNSTQPVPGKAPQGAKAQDAVQVPAAVAAADQAARQQVALQQSQGQQEGPEAKTGPSGLMEASFAGLLQPETTRPTSLRGNPVAQSAAETAAEVLPVGEETDLSPTPQRLVIGEANADPAEALLKKAPGQETSLEPGDSQALTDKGQPSLFEGTLASAGGGKTGTAGEMNLLQSAADPLRTTATFNEEVRILDQVLNQLPLNRMGDKNRLVIRLNPEELGEVKLDLVMDKDRLKAHLVTQTQQVQNILEKHLPRLQDALQNQGIKLDQIEVSVDSQGNNQGREHFDRNHQPAPWASSFGPERNPAEIAPTVAVVNQARTRQEGLSLRI